MISYVQDEWMCIHLHIPTAMTFRIFMDGTITSWMISFSVYIYIIHGTWNGYVLHALLAKSSLPMVFRWHMTMRCYGFLWPTHFCG